MEWFNQVDATYRQELREQNDLNWARIEARLDALQATLRAEFHQEMTGVRSDLDVHLAELRSDILKWMFLFWTGTALTGVGLVTALR